MPSPTPFFLSFHPQDPALEGVEIIFKNRVGGIWEARTPMPHFLREAQGECPQHSCPSVGFPQWNRHGSRTELDRASLRWSLRSPVTPCLTSEHDELSKICHNPQDDCTRVERGPMDLKGSLRGNKKIVYRLLTRGHNWPKDISVEASRQTSERARFSLNRCQHRWNDVRLGHLSILRSISCPHSTPFLLSITGNYISQAPLPTGLANERHWGKAEVMEQERGQGISPRVCLPALRWNPSSSGGFLLWF